MFEKMKKYARGLSFLLVFTLLTGLFGSVMTAYAEATAETVVSEAKQNEAESSEGSETEQNAGTEEAASESESKESEEPVLMGSSGNPGDVTDKIEVMLDKFSYIENGKAEVIVIEGGKVKDPLANYDIKAIFPKVPEFNFGYSWKIKLNSENNPYPIKKDDFFHIELPYKDLMIYNTPPKTITYQGQEVGTYSITNGILTAMFLRDFDKEFNLSGTFELKGVIHKNKFKGAIKLPDKENVEATVHVEITDPPQHSDFDEYDPKKPVIEKDGYQYPYQKAENQFEYNFRFNRGAFKPLFRGEVITPKQDLVFIDELPGDLEVVTNQFKLEIPLLAPLVNEQGEAQNIVTSNLIFSPELIKGKHYKVLELSKADFPNPKDYIKKVKEEQKNSGKPVVGIIDKKIIVIAFGNLPSDNGLKYGDFEKWEEQLEARIKSFPDGDTRKINDSQIQKMKEKYHKNQPVVSYSLYFKVVALEGKNDTTYKNTGKLMWEGGNAEDTFVITPEFYGKATIKYDVNAKQIRVKKVWQDNGNQPLPEKVEIKLFADGIYKDRKFLTEKNNWTNEFNNLLIMKGGHTIKYKVEEVVPDGYTQVDSSEEEIKEQIGTDLVKFTVITITNRRNPTNPPSNPPSNPPTNPPSNPPSNPPTIPPVNPPLAPPTTPPTTPDLSVEDTIEDEDVVLADEVDVPEDDVPEVETADADDVPLANIPKTGEYKNSLVFLVVMGLGLISAVGLIAIKLFNKKFEE